MTLVAGADANPDARGRASPLTVRVYALKTSGAFESADFFSLFEKDQATLGAEMVQREEMLLRPGDSKKLEMTLAADIKAIGVMAAYRDLDRARWREVRVVEPGKALVLTTDLRRAPNPHRHQVARRRSASSGRQRLVGRQKALEQVGDEGGLARLPQGAATR